MRERDHVRTLEQLPERDADSPVVLLAIAGAQRLVGALYDAYRDWLYLVGRFGSRGAPDRNAWHEALLTAFRATAGG